MYVWINEKVLTALNDSAMWELSGFALVPWVRGSFV